MYHGFHKNMTQ